MKCCRCLVINDLNVNKPAPSRVRTIVKEDLSIDVQGRGCTTRGQDYFRVAELVTTAVRAAKRPNHCALERCLEEGKPGKPIVRLLCRPDPVFQTRKAGVVGLVHGELEAYRVVEEDVEVAVLTMFGDGDARSDACEILVKCDSHQGPIFGLRKRNTAHWAPAASVSDVLDIDLGEVDGRRRRSGGRIGYCCAETKDDRGDKEFHGESS